MVTKNSVRLKRQSPPELKIWPGKQQNFTRQTINLLGACSTGLLIVVMMMLLVPTVSSVSATSTDSTTTAVNALVKPSISLSAPSSLNLELMPDVESEFASVSGTVTVSTNNASGYRLLINSANTNTLVSHDNSSSNPNDVISSIDSSSTPNSFVDNTWGYYLGTAQPSDTTIYQPLSTTATEALKTDTSSTDTGSTSYYNLAFGTKVSNTLPAGTYSNSVVISAVANPLEIHSLSDLTFMQDMTTSICAETPSAYNSATGTTDKTSTYYANPVTKQLIDLRDGKKYWVAKLADGECWMTQNLALNLGTAPDPETEAKLGRFVSKLTPADSDVSEEWVPSSSTNEVKLEGAGLSTNIVNQWSWNFGALVTGRPRIGQQCDNNSLTQTSELNQSCAIAGIVDITGTTWKPTFEAQLGDFVYNANDNEFSTTPNAGSSTLIAVDTTEQTYDAHYLFGVYYQFNTATAGQGAISDYAVATTSICPSGWRLTSANRGTDYYPTEANDYYRLANAYGYGNFSLDQYNNAFGKYPTGYNMTGAPFYFPMSGVISMGKGSLYQLGMTGRHVSSATTISSASTVQILPDGFFVTDAQLKANGYAVRCLAR